MEIKLVFIQVYLTQTSVYSVNSTNFADYLLRRLEQYNQSLQSRVEEQTELYNMEKERGDELLYQMLPKQVAEDLKKGKVKYFSSCIP